MFVTCSYLFNTPIKTSNSYYLSEGGRFYKM